VKEKEKEAQGKRENTGAGTRWRQNICETKMSRNLHRQKHLRGGKNNLKKIAHQHPQQQQLLLGTCRSTTSTAAAGVTVVVFFATAMIE
jgi:hypothetical protein